MKEIGDILSVFKGNKKEEETKISE